MADTDSKTTELKDSFDKPEEKKDPKADWIVTPSGKRRPHP